MGMAKLAPDSDDVKTACLKTGATPFRKSVADTVAYRHDRCTPANASPRVFANQKAYI